MPNRRHAPRPDDHAGRLSRHQSLRPQRIVLHEKPSEAGGSDARPGRCLEILANQLGLPLVCRLSSATAPQAGTETATSNAFPIAQVAIAQVLASWSLS